MNTLYKKYLDYIRNAGEGATTKNFCEDWEPIGLSVLMEMKDHDLIYVVDGLLKVKEGL